MTVVAACEQRGAGPENGDRAHDGLLDELIRQLATHVDHGGERAATAHEDANNEEVIVDVRVDGIRYLMVRMPPPDSALVSLSPREQEIAQMVARGCSNRTIATSLQISQWTVGTHIRHIYAKLGVASRAAMVARLVRVGHKENQQSKTRSTMPSHANAGPIDAIGRAHATPTEGRKSPTAPRNHQQSRRIEPNSD